MTTLELSELKPTRSHTGHYKYGWYVWELVTELDLTVDDLAEIQANQGYPANPYGLYDAKKIQRTYRSGKTEFKYMWKCATSCD